MEYTGIANYHVYPIPPPRLLSQHVAWAISLPPCCSSLGWRWGIEDPNGFSHWDKVLCSCTRAIRRAGAFWQTSATDTSLSRQRCCHERREIVHWVTHHHKRNGHGKLQPQSEAGPQASFHSPSTKWRWFYQSSNDVISEHYWNKGICF